MIPNRLTKKIRPQNKSYQNVMMIIEPTNLSDDRSVSSTVDVHEACLQKKKESCRRRVSFQEKSNLSYQSPYNDRYETAHMWYTADEYQTFKNRHMDALKMVIRRERGNLNDPKSYNRVLERLYETSCKTPTATCSDDMERLHQLLSNEFPGRTGLEKTAIRRIRLDKKLRRRDITDAVMEIQEDTAYPYLSPIQRAQTIALVCEEISLPSRVFASCLASAGVVSGEEEQ